jgi:hypothetical protein
MKYLVYIVLIILCVFGFSNLDIVIFSNDIIPHSGWWIVLFVFIIIALFDE